MKCRHIFGTSKFLKTLMILCLMIIIYYLGSRCIYGNNKALVRDYSIEYPKTFYISTRGGNYISFHKKECEQNNPKEYCYNSVGIRLYEGDIPSYMKLENWLDKVSTTKSWDEFENVNVPCKSSKALLRKEIDEVPYGGHDDTLSGDECLYFSVKNIKTIEELPNIKNDSNRELEILEFNSQYMGSDETHTLIDTGNGSLWDIYMYTGSGASLTQKEEIEKAYQLLKSSIKSY